MLFLRMKLCLGFIAVLIATSSSVKAAIVAYKFHGSVVPSNTTPWGIPASRFGPMITGAFIYDTESPVTHDLGTCDCVGYREQRLNGFFAKSGTVNIRADDYIVEVLNDKPQQDQPDADILSIGFSNLYDPSLQLPLVVDSTAHSQGLFSVNFVADSNLFSSSALPASLNLADFDTRLGFLSDTPTGVYDIVWVVTSLTKLDLLPGDYDLDNDVDEADYLKWKSTYGSTGELVADGNRDGVVDAADYTVWRNAFNPPALLAAAFDAEAVPEPSAIFLLGIGLWALSRLRMHARSRHIRPRD